MEDHCTCTTTTSAARRPRTPWAWRAPTRTATRTSAPVDTGKHTPTTLRATRRTAIWVASGPQTRGRQVLQHRARQDAHLLQDGSHHGCGSNATATASLASATVATAQPATALAAALATATLASATQPPPSPPPTTTVYAYGPDGCAATGLQIERPWRRARQQAHRLHDHQRPERSQPTCSPPRTCTRRPAFDCAAQGGRSDAAQCAEYAAQQGLTHESVQYHAGFRPTAACDEQHVVSSRFLARQLRRLERPDQRHHRLQRWRLPWKAMTSVRSHTSSP